MSHHSVWEFIKIVYLGGVVISMAVTFLVSRDKQLLMRLLAAALVGITWPLSFPVVLLFSLL